MAEQPTYKSASMMRRASGVGFVDLVRERAVKLHEPVRAAVIQYCQFDLDGVLEGTVMSSASVSVMRAEAVQRIALHCPGFRELSVKLMS